MLKDEYSRCFCHVGIPVQSKGGNVGGPVQISGKHASHYLL